MEVKIDIYFDGACKNVKGSRTEPFGVGVAVFIDDTYSSIYSKSIWGAEGTSNIAEWCACVHACELADFLHGLVTGRFGNKRIGIPTINIYSDSEIITNQFNDKYQIREQAFIPYYKTSKERINKFNKDLKITWIPRDKNWVADVLSKRGLSRDFRTEGADIPFVKSKRYRGQRFVGCEEKVVNS